MTHYLWTVYFTLKGAAMLAIGTGMVATGGAVCLALVPAVWLLERQVRRP